MLSAARFADLLAGQQFAFQGGTGPLRVFHAFSRLCAAIEGLDSSVRRLVLAQEKGPDVYERLAALELDRHQFQAEVEGVLLKAEGKLKAASNAEARERALKKSYERLTDPFALDGEEGSEPELPSVDVEPSQTEGMHVLRVGVEANNKAQALRAKFL